MRGVDDANLFYTQRDQRLIQDQAVFLEYIEAAITKEEVAAAYVQKTLMSDPLKKSVNSWETGTNTDKYASPFVGADPY